MYNLLKEIKINKELKRFEKFKANYEFKQKEIINDNGSLYCDGVCIKSGDDGELLGESDSFVNVSYKMHGCPLSKVLSNLFPYEFYFSGEMFGSAEGFFQSLKFKNKKMQHYVFKMSGVNSNNIKAAGDYDWRESSIVFFKGKQYNRNGKNYSRLIDKMYMGLLQNPLFMSALKNVGDKYILHSIGETDKTKTTFTRYEFEFELNCLKDYCRKFK